MTTEQSIAFGTVAATLVMLAWGKWRYDVVAVLAMLAVVVSGIVPAAEAFAGFAHPAVITVAAVLIISKGLQNAGLVDLVVRAINPLRERPNLQITAQCLVIAALSSFMNNVGALALMLPVALRNAYRNRYPPAMSLMPLAFASLLGGLTTLIGTPPNIIIAGIRANVTGQPFGMFDFMPVGLTVAAAGLAFLAIAGKHLLPKRDRAQAAEDAFSITDYITEARVAEEADVIGKSIVEIEKLADGDVAVTAVIRKDDRRLIPAGYTRVHEGDVLILRGDTSAIQTLIERSGMELAGSDGVEKADLQSDDVVLTEAVIGPGSWIAEKTPTSLRLRTVFDLNLLAVARQGHRIDERLDNVTFHIGDVVLLQGARAEMPAKLAELGLLPLAERSLDLGRRRSLAIAVSVFAASIVLILTGLLPTHVAFTAVAAAFVILDIVKTSEIYAAVDWPVVVLLGALFPVAAALERSGGAALIAQTILQIADGQSPIVALLILLLLTMFISDLINNNATALLMAPVAITLATRLGVSVDAFLMAVALGASCAFLTPIGHQANSLVLEPGGYRFADYWRLGLPLEIIIVLVGLPVLVLWWPL